MKIYYLLASFMSAYLFKLACGQAYTQRGYYAIGGEIIILFLPVILHITYVVFSDLRKELR